MEWFRAIFEKALIQEMTLSFVIIVMRHVLFAKNQLSNRSDFKLRMKQ